MIRRLLLSLALIVSVGGIVAAAMSPALAGGDAMWPVAWLPWAPVGYLILLKRPGNNVGSALLAIGLSWGAGFLCLALANRVTSPVAGAWIELTNSIFGVLPWMGIVWLLLIFPSGRLEGRAERVIATLVALATFVMVTAFAVSSVPMEETGLTSPLAVPALATIAAALVEDSSFFAVIVLAAAALVVTLRRWFRSSGVERLQYRWLILGATAYVVIAVAGQLMPDDSPFDFLWLAGGWAIPISIGIAVLRYRLYEIDRIISRSVTYAMVVGLLAVVYMGALTWLTTLLPDQSQLVVAAVTLGVAFLFNPVRRKVQAGVDHRFNRSRYDAQRVMDGFAESLRDQVDGRDMMTGWVGVVSETMQPSSVAVWVRESA